MHGSKVKLVCFDLGGVVIRICRSWREGCAAAGLDLRGDDESLFNGTDGWYARRDLTDLYQTGRITTEEFAQRFSGAQDSHHIWSPIDCCVWKQAQRSASRKPRKTSCPVLAAWLIPRLPPRRGSRFLPPPAPFIIYQRNSHPQEDSPIFLV